MYQTSNSSQLTNLIDKFYAQYNFSVSKFNLPFTEIFRN